MPKLSKHGWIFLLIVVFLITSGSVCNPTDPDPVEHNITAFAEAGGSISPSATIKVNDGSNLTFTITPDTGYGVLDVKVDGSSVGAVTTYTFTNVKNNHTIEATFLYIPTIIGVWATAPENITWEFKSDGSFLLDDVYTQNPTGQCEIGTYSQIGNTLVLNVISDPDNDRGLGVTPPATVTVTDVVITDTTLTFMMTFEGNTKTFTLSKM